MRTCMKLEEVVAGDIYLMATRKQVVLPTYLRAGGISSQVISQIPIRRQIHMMDTSNEFARATKPEPIAKGGNDERTKTRQPDVAE